MNFYLIWEPIHPEVYKTSSNIVAVSNSKHNWKKLWWLLCVYFSDPLFNVWNWFPNMGIFSGVCNQVICLLVFLYHTCKDYQRIISCQQGQLLFSHVFTFLWDTMVLNTLTSKVTCREKVAWKEVVPLSTIKIDVRKKIRFKKRSINRTFDFRGCGTLANLER